MPGAFTLNYFPLTKSQQELAPHAEQTDQNSQEYLDALKNKSLFALQLTQNQMPTFGGTAFADRLRGHDSYYVPDGELTPTNIFDTDIKHGVP